MPAVKLFSPFILADRPPKRFKEAEENCRVDPVAGCSGPHPVHKGPGASLLVDLASRRLHGGVLVGLAHHGGLDNIQGGSGRRSNGPRQGTNAEILGAAGPAPSFYVRVDSPKNMSNRDTSSVLLMFA